jgi:electron transfer flavoprotein alpha subunit
MSTAWIVTTNDQISSIVEIGRSLGCSVKAIVVGDATVGSVDEVLRIALPDGVPTEAAAAAVADAVTAEAGDIVLVPNRGSERVLAGAVAARLGAPVLTGATRVTQNAIEMTRFGGIATEIVAVAGPVVVLLPGGRSVEGDPTASSEVAGPRLLAAKVAAQQTSAKESVDLGAAKRIVCVGRGFKAQDDLQLAQGLASTLGAEIACSRPMAEGVGWMPKDSYVGVSGQSVKPDIYLALGVSGQLQHMAGVQDSKVIVAVNSDEHAPIFAHADYGIVGDLYEVVPALTLALK